MYTSVPEESIVQFLPSFVGLWYMAQVSFLAVHDIKGQSHPNLELRRNKTKAEKQKKGK